MSAAASSSLLISIQGWSFDVEGGAMVGLTGSTIGGGLGVGAFARTWGCCVVVCSADALRLSGIRSTVSVLEDGLVGSVTTPS